MIKAVEDKIVVEFLTMGVSKGGIIVPADAQVDAQGYGRVTSIGEDVPKCYEEGQILVFHRNGGQLMTFGTKVMRVLKHDEVYGILTDQATIDSLGNLELGEKRIIS